MAAGPPNWERIKTVVQSLFRAGFFAEKYSCRKGEKIKKLLLNAGDGRDKATGRKPGIASREPGGGKFKFLEGQCRGGKRHCVRLMETL